MSSIKYLEENGVVFYPVVHEQGVRDSDGVALPTKLSQTGAAITNIGGEVAILNGLVQNLSGNEAIISWDGNSTPVVANIPAGVTVEYNETTYTGELTASTDTLNKTYYIAQDSDTWDRYITTKSGNNYIWFNLGSTDIDMSDYERKDDNVWLTEEEFEALPIKDPTKTYNVYEEVTEL